MLRYVIIVLIIFRQFRPVSGTCTKIVSGLPSTIVNVRNRVRFDKNHYSAVYENDNTQRNHHDAHTVFNGVRVCTYILVIPYTPKN